MLQMVNTRKYPDQPAAIDDTRTLPSTSISMLNMVEEPKIPAKGLRSNPSGANDDGGGKPLSVSGRYNH